MKLFKNSAVQKQPFHNHDYGEDDDVIITFIKKLWPRKGRLKMENLCRDDDVMGHTDGKKLETKMPQNSKF